MNAKIIEFPNKADQIWFHIKPHVYKIAFDRSGSEEIANGVTLMVEETYKSCVPPKLSIEEDISDMTKAVFSDYVHQIIGGFVAELTGILTTWLMSNKINDKTHS